MIKIIVLFLLLFLASPSLAAEEVTTERLEAFSGMISTVLNFVISGAGIIAFIALLWGGLGYLTAAGSPMAMAQAKKRVIGGLLGVSLILTSYVIVRQINPDILNEIFRLPEISFKDGEVHTPPGPEVTVFEYQEMPFGTILETRILAKNISCFDNNSNLVDCHSGQPVTSEEKSRIIDVMSRDFPEAWPNPEPKDAEIAYLCYAFDKDGEFLDGDPSQPGIQPIPTNDRLDCIERVVRALDAKSLFLKEKVEELAQLTSQCNCGACNSCGGCPCIPFGSCRCGAPCGGDPCPARARIDQIRIKTFKEGGAGLWMHQILEGRNLLKESELVKVSVDSYEKMTVVNQIRYLASHFLPPHIASLEIDLSYLQKVEEMYKMQCEHGTYITHATFIQLLKEAESDPFTSLERNKFCLNGNQPAWGEDCIVEERIDIDRWCLEFRCTDCEQSNCGICNLDDLEKGIAISFPWGDEELVSYKCSEYRINQEDGIQGREVDDELGIMCRIQTDSDKCNQLSQNPITFYCSKDFIGAPVLTQDQKGISEPTIDQYVVSGYPRSNIAIGQLVDDAEVYVQELMSEMKILVDTSAPEVVCPSYDKNDPNNQCRLYHLPPRCVCYALVTSDRAGCGPGCGTTHGCLCNNCGGCPGCACTPCLVGGEYHPCPLSVIFKRRDETKYWYETDIDSVKKRVEQVKNLILAMNLMEHQPSRAEMLNQLQDSQEKLARCISSFGNDPELATAATMPFSCYWLLYLQDLGVDGGGMKFNPLIETCYPYNSQSPYGDNSLTESQRAACYRDRESAECQAAIADLMFDYFCGEQKF